MNTLGQLIKDSHSLATNFPIPALADHFSNLLTRYPHLELLCSNRRSPWRSAEDAWSLYERNWRFIESGQLETAERELIDRLTAHFGAGVPFG